MPFWHRLIGWKHPSVRDVLQVAMGSAFPMDAFLFVVLICLISCVCVCV